MLPVSSQFLSVIRNSHQFLTTAILLTPSGATGTALIGRALKVSNGAVTLDSTADIRGAIDMTVIETWPTGNSTADLVPYGTEIAVSRGVVLANGATESAPLGIYRISDIEQAGAPFGALRITAVDRMGGVKDALLESPVYCPVGTSYATIFNILLNGGTLGSNTANAVYSFPIVIQWDATDSTGSGNILTVGLTAESDRFQFLNDLVVGLGKVWYFDYRGILVIKTPPNPAVPVFSVDSGHNGVLVSAHRTLSRSNVYNAVIMTGEALNSLPPPMYTVRDTDPNSVTYYYGPFGKVPQTFSDPSITNLTQAIAAATTKLNLGKGLPYHVDFTQVPNPALEPLDVVSIVYPDDITAQPHVKTETHVLEQVVIGLSPADAMSCSTRLINNKGVLS